MDDSRDDTTPEQPPEKGKQGKQGDESSPKPGDTKSKLAAARAAGAAKRKDAPEPSDTASKLAAARAAGAAKKGGASDTASKLAAARAAGAAKGKPEGGEAAPGAAGKGAKPAGKPVARPPMPRKPAGTAPAGTSRRGFLSWFGAGWAFFTGACAAALLGTARFFMPNVLAEPPTRFKIGPPSTFPPDSVSNDFKAQFGIWIVHTIYNGKDVIYALRTVCTHLGCTPNWLDTERKFKCPCHGSGFYITGINFEGPAPRPLERYGIALAPDGNLEVDKSQLFQQELGQWEDPASFVELA